jgi:hypothetical protein
VARTAEALGAFWARWAQHSCGDYCPLYRDIAAAVATDGPLLERLVALPVDAHQPNVLMGAVHDLLLREPDLPLAAVYRDEPLAASAPASAPPAFLALCHDRWAELEPVCRVNRTQTNEVGRTALIGLALSHLHRRHGKPLHLIDVGASAGLNLRLDTYRLDYGSAGATGPADSPVVVRCDLRGAAPEVAAALPPITGRIGLDRAPIDLRDAERARWLVACTWPGTGRLARQAAAIDAARLDPPTVVEGDAVESLLGLLAGASDDALPVVTTTWVLAYFSKDDRARFQQVLLRSGRDRPVAWVSAEWPTVVAGLPPVLVAQPAPPPGIDVMGLLTFAGDGEPTSEVLGLAHPHGAWLEWHAARTG